MAMSINTYELERVYFVQIKGEKVIRKMILSNEELIYYGPYDMCIKRTFTIAGIGEVIKHAYDNGLSKWTINGVKVNEFTFNVYSDLNGGKLPNPRMEIYDYVNETFAKIHNIFRTCPSGKSIYMYMWKWDGIKAVKESVYLSKFIKEGETISLITPKFSEEDFNNMGFYLTKEKCENTNIVEVIDFSF